MNALVPLYDYYIIMYPVWLRRTAEVAATTAGSDDVTQQYFVHTHDADDDDTKTSVCVCVCGNGIKYNLYTRMCDFLAAKRTSIENFHVLLLEFHNNLHIMYTKNNMDFIYLFKFFYSPHYRAYTHTCACVCVCVIHAPSSYICWIVYELKPHISVE